MAGWFDTVKRALGGPGPSLAGGAGVGLALSLLKGQGGRQAQAQVRKASQGDAIRASKQMPGSPSAPSLRRSAPTGGGYMAEGGPRSEGPDYSGDLAALQRALESFSISMPSESDIQQQAAGEVNAAYDPRIRAIAAEMADAKRRANVATSQLGSIYDSLVANYKGQIAPSKNRTAQAKQMAKQATDSMKGEIQADYSSRLQELTDMYKELGIESAAASTHPELLGNQADYLAQAELAGNTEQSVYDVTGLADVNYWNAGAVAAQQEGVEGKQQIQNDLLSYLNRQGAEKAALEGAKGEAMASAVAKLRSAAAESYGEAQESMWNKMLQLSKYKSDLAGEKFNQDLALEKLAADAAKARSSSTPTKGLLGASAYLGDSGLTGWFEKLMNNTNTWMNSVQAKDWLSGGTGRYDPEDYAQAMYWGAKRNNLSEDQARKLYEAMLVYRGRGS